MPRRWAVPGVLVESDELLQIPSSRLLSFPLSRLLTTDEMRSEVTMRDYARLGGITIEAINSRFLQREKYFSLQLPTVDFAIISAKTIGNRDDYSEDLPRPGTFLLIRNFISHAACAFALLVVRHVRDHRPASNDPAYRIGLGVTTICFRTIGRLPVTLPAFPPSPSSRHIHINRSKAVRNQ